MEVIPITSGRRTWLFCILHTCGGDPRSLSIPLWSGIVFSTHVEVILMFTVSIDITEGILHTCGGDPTIRLGLFKRVWYSPHMWRWSYNTAWALQARMVFSTHVEVIPNILGYTNGPKGILHTCGGDPKKGYSYELTKEYSPHMWRWSFFNFFKFCIIWVFSTHVESVTVLERTDK